MPGAITGQKAKQDDLDEIVPNRVYSTEEAARLLRLNRQTVNELCRKGQIKGKLLGKWKILGQSLIDFLQGNSKG